MTAQPTSINLASVMMDLKNGKTTTKYLEVKWRLLWFREVCSVGSTIETKLITLDVETEFEEEEDEKVWDASAWNGNGGWKKTGKKITKRAKGYAVFQATVTDDKGNVATGTKMERAVSFPDFLEKAETGAIGRALAALGYGTQFTEEMTEGRIVDSPVGTKAGDSSPAPSPAQRQSKPNPAPEPQAETVKHMINKAKVRAKGLGFSSMVEWDKFV